MPLEGEDRITSAELKGRVDQYASDFVTAATLMAQRSAKREAFTAEIQGDLKQNHKEQDPKKARSQAAGAEQAQVMEADLAAADGEEETKEATGVTEKGRRRKNKRSRTRKGKPQSLPRGKGKRSKTELSTKRRGDRSQSQGKDQRTQLAMAEAATQQV